MSMRDAMCVPRVEPVAGPRDTGSGRGGEVAMVRKAPSRDKCPRGYRPTPGQRVDDLQLGAKATLHDVQSLNTGPERSRDEFVAPVDRGQCPSHANPTQVTCGRLPPQSRGRGGTCHRRGKRSWRNPSPVPLRSGPLPELHVIRRQRSIARSREITPDGAAHERCLLPRMLGVPAQPRSCKTGRVGRQSLPGQTPRRLAPSGSPDAFWRPALYTCTRAGRPRRQDLVDR